MRKRTLIIAAILLLIGKGVYDNQLSQKVLTFDEARQRFLRYQNELIIIADYVTNESELGRYYLDTYTNADLLPKPISAHMRTYFRKISLSDNAAILECCHENFYYFRSASDYEGAMFILSNEYQGKDGEGVDVRFMQGYLYLRSDIEAYEIHGIKLNFHTIEELAPKWYFVTSYLD